VARRVSNEHKQAMKRGRELSAIVDPYLKAIGRSKPRGRKVSVEELGRRREEALSEAATATGIARLKLVQAAADLEERITSAEAAETVDIAALEAAFIQVAAEYGEAQSISYSTWREVGVSAEILKEIGIKQTRRRS